MDYYIEPEQVETDFLRITTPEEIKICDPACGSGHILVYAFDLLYAIYEEEGYDPAGIAEKILTRNLYGIEIDERAGALAAFALTMKALARQRRFFDKPVRPNICVMEKIEFDKKEWENYMNFIGQDLFSEPQNATLHQFDEAKHFGSLIRPEVINIAGLLQTLEDRDIPEDLFLRETHKKVRLTLHQIDYLSPRYHVVIANPPYMGARKMNCRLGAWAKENYLDSKSNLFAMFMDRGLNLTLKYCFFSMITMESWMFLSSFEKLRAKLLGNTTIQSMVHMPFLGKGGTSMGIYFGTTAFVAQNILKPNFSGHYCCVRYFETDDDGIPYEFPPKNERMSTTTTTDFQKIPGSPIAYWASFRQRTAFEKFPRLDSWCPVKQGLATADNNLFLRIWHEVSLDKVGFNYQELSLTATGEHKWFPYNKGGSFRRWYGNAEFLVNWENDGKSIRNYADETGYIRSRVQNENYYLKKGVTWTFISSSNFGVRLMPGGYLFDVAGSSAFPEQTSPEKLTTFLGSCVTPAMLKLMNPTLNFQVGDIASLPIGPQVLAAIPVHIPASLIVLSKTDWNAYETSWDFTTLPLLTPEHRQTKLAETYAHLRDHWSGMTLEL